MDIEVGVAGISRDYQRRKTRRKLPRASLVAAGAATAPFSQLLLPSRAIGVV